MRPPHTSKVAIILLTLAVAAMSLTAAVAVAQSDSTSARLKAPRIKAPRLGVVPAVAKTTTGRKPPKNVVFRKNSLGGATGSLATYSPGIGEVLVPGVPPYFWRDGCAPTAVGMVIGYYDANGYDRLISGDATTQTGDVDQSIASHGTESQPGHFEDYSLPYETTGSGLMPDKSEAPAGDEHVANCIADFMHTAWSADGLEYGCTATGGVASGFVGYVKSKYPDAKPQAVGYAGSALTWSLFKAEIDAGRPMLFMVDSNGDGRVDHLVATIGYRELNGYAEYACWDTWSTSIVRWQRFRAVSSAYSWGVWGGFAVSMGGVTVPGPTEPTPTPATGDVTPPATVAAGLDDAWHNATVVVSFEATDGESGVAYTEYSVGGSDWSRATSISFPVPKRPATGVVYDLAYRSVDAAGNVEATRTGRVNLDSIKPLTTTNADGLVHTGSFTLILTAEDGHSGVHATRFSVDGAPYVTGTSVTLSKTGKHTVKFFSTDNAGNSESPRSCVVRIS